MHWSPVTLVGIEIYRFAPTYLIDKLQRTQNKVIKILFGNNEHYKSTANLCKEFGILNVTQLRDYTVIMNNFFNNEFKIKDCHKLSYLRDKTVKFKIPMVKNNYGFRTKKHYVPLIFNKLPDELLILNNYRQLKRMVRKWLIDS
jgi:hypothetical protein